MTESATETSTPETAEDPDRQAEARDFFALMKPRVMSLVVFTAFCGMWLAPGTLHPVLAAVAILCIAVAAGASGAINMWYDRDIDGIMERTRGRPIPSGRVTPTTTLEFGCILAFGAVAVIGLAANWTAAALLALTIAFYVFVYTIWLKRRTPQNIVIGGAAGAFPPMVGWAVTSGEISLASIALFAIIFMWTPPHFWALSLYRKGDYERAGVPMLPVVAGKRETRRQILLYTIGLIPVTLTPTLLGVTGWVYFAGAAGLGGLFLICAIRVWFDTSERSAKLMFGYSILYLFLLFLLMLADRVPAAGG